MEILQKRMATHIRFDFADAMLTYCIRDNSGEREMRIDYANIPNETRRVFERNTWLRNVGLIWCALGALLLGAAIVASKATPGSAFWLVLGVICLGFYKATQTNYTVFDSNAGSIWIIEDMQKDRILEEIVARRKSLLRARYGVFNPDNDRARELQKFDWLVEQRAMTREEADRLIAGGGVGPDGKPLLPPPDRTLH